MKTRIHHLTLFLAALLAPLVAHAGFTLNEMSPQSKACAECHKKESPALYQQWGSSKHYRGNIGCYEAYRSLHDIVPRPDHKASGEERAWGRRLVKRFAIDASSYDDRAFEASSNPTTAAARRRGRRRAKSSAMRRASAASNGTPGLRTRRASTPCRSAPISANSSVGRVSR